MSTKNFVSYGDAETLFTGVGNKISGKQAKPTTISYANWLLLTPQQQETGNWLVTGVPGADLSLRVLALETNKQDKTDNNLQTTSKETTGAINELKSGLNGLTSNNVSGYDDITATTIETAYVCPSDGYLFASSESDTTGVIRAVISDSAGNSVGYIYMNITDEYQIQTLYLRKGFKVYVSNRTANATVRFNKLA